MLLRNQGFFVLFLLLYNICGGGMRVYSEVILSMNGEAILRHILETRKAFRGKG